MEFHDRAVIDNLSTELATLRAENARLREALARLVAAQRFCNPKAGSSSLSSGTTAGVYRDD